MAVPPVPLPLNGWPIWGRPLALVALMIFCPLSLLPTPLAPLAVTWIFLLVMAIWGVGVVAFIGAVVGTDRPVLPYLERLLRRWVAWFSADPGALWVQWAREAHHTSQAHWCLERAATLGGAEGLFQEGLAYFDGGFGAGGQIAGTERMEAVADRVVAHRAGRWALGVGVALLGGLWVGVVATFFLVGASGFFFLPLLMLAPPGIMLAWQAWQLRREMPKQGRDRLREAAEAGDPEACFQLAMAYRKGTPLLPRDDQCATAWFRRAAEAGHREAMCALAQAYLGGHGVLRNPREAARWSEASRQNPV